MRFFVLVSVAVRSIRARFVRSFLTMLTAAVGIAGVTSSMALMDGITQQVNRDVRSLGIRVIEVLNPSIFKGRPGIPDATLTTSHLSDLREALGDIPVAPTRVGFYVTKTEGLKKPIFTVGVATDHNMASMFDVGMERGSFFGYDAYAMGSKVCVLDSALARQAFGETDPLGKEVVIGFGDMALELEVVGVLKDPFSLREHLDFFDSLDPARMAFARFQAYKNLYFPMTLLPTKSDTLHSLKVGAPSISEVGPLFERVKETVGEDLAKTTWTLKDWSDLVVSTTNDFNIIGDLLWVALLFVTGVLIGTVNLISIRERFREVGVRLTEGARPFDIWLQLTVENCILSVAGGALGIALGFPTAWALANFVARWEPAFTPQGVFVPIAVAVVLGILSTFWPAWKAAKVNPVDILRKG
ncbi:MAG: ABC transporter permease [Planctomycetota bacterium]